jgi:hypothetical protein
MGFFLKCCFHEYLSGNTRKAQEFTESFETASVLLLFPLEFLLASRYCSSNFADLFAHFSLENAGSPVPPFKRNLCKIGNPLTN